MTERSHHSDIVREWRQCWPENPPVPVVVEVCEHALDALWRRAHQSLGEITLVAIADRVLHQGTELFPHLAALKTETSGVNFAELRQVAPALEGKLLEESLLFLVVELMRVLGALTGEVLTPGLHAALRAVRVPTAAERGGTQ